MTFRSWMNQANHEILYLWEDPRSPPQPLEPVCEPDADYIPWQNNVPEINNRRDTFFARIIPVGDEFLPSPSVIPIIPLHAVFLYKRAEENQKNHLFELLLEKLVEMYPESKSTLICSTVIMQYKHYVIIA